jgi:isocitrate dehydrogenase kinase/phosphatase
MTKRLQVLFGDAEWREIQRAARAERTTVAEWVRQALRVARRATSTKSVDGKLSAIRTATGHQFPTADIDQMNAEIVRGYLDTPQP